MVISVEPTAGILLKRLPQSGNYQRIGYFDDRVEEDRRKEEDEKIIIQVDIHCKG